MRQQPQELVQRKKTNKHALVWVGWAQLSGFSSLCDIGQTLQVAQLERECGFASHLPKCFSTSLS